MYDVTTDFLDALRQSHTIHSRVDAYYNSALVYPNVPFTEGSVQVSSGTGVARTLSLTVADVSLWDVLLPIGTELRAYRGIRYPGVAEPEVVPLGVFDVDSQSISLGPSGAISITAPDRWARVQRARFEIPEKSVKSARVTAEISRLIRGAVPNVGVTITATSTALVGSLIWDRDRERAVIDLCASIGAEAQFDWTGQVVIRDAPVITRPAIKWRVDASPTGVMIGGSRTRERTRTFNVVVVTSTNADGAAPFTPQVVADTDPLSPTYVGGAMGRVPFFYSSPVIRTAAQALVAGRAILNKTMGCAASLSVESAVNPALDRGDVFYAVLPSGEVERHLAESFSVPLTPGASQSITTRSAQVDESNTAAIDAFALGPGPTVPPPDEDWDWHTGPSAGSLLAWYVADDATGFYGDPVFALPRHDGHGPADLTNPDADSTKPMTLITGGPNGHQGIDCYRDGLGQVVVLGSGAPVPGYVFDDFTAFVVWKPKLMDQPAGLGIGLWSGDYRGNALFTGNVSMNVTVVDTAGDPQPESYVYGESALDAPEIIEVQYVAGDSGILVRTKGTPRSQTWPLVESPNFGYADDEGGGSMIMFGGANCVVYEYVLIHGILAEADLVGMRAYMSTKYGLPA
jgi:hypothetical protein